MKQWKDISRLIVASLAVSNASRLVHDDEGFSRPSGLLGSRPEDFIGSRLLRLLCVVGVWMSAQATVWVVCGLSGILLNLLLLPGISGWFKRLAAKKIGASRTTKVGNGGVSCLAI